MNEEPTVHCENLRAIVWLAEALALPAQGMEPERVFARIGELGELTARAIAVFDAIDLDPYFNANIDSSSRAIDDIAFLARMELRHYGGWVFAQRGPIDVATARVDYERLRQHLIDLLVGVEVEICATLDEPSQLHPLLVAKISRSRATRRAYYRFIAAIHELRELRDAGQLHPTELVCAARESLETLTHTPLLEALRPDDRQRIEGLSRQLQTFVELRADDELEARRMCAQLYSLSETLACVQARRELLMHDWEMASELLWTAKLERSVARGDARLDELATRDQELARALERGVTAEIGRILARIYDDLAYALARPSLADRRAAANVASI